ncbi:alpha/beta fold hydrolase [Arthrobacter sp. JCM 19049]|uniref:alpha/beta fold hydrolase n=1 Tax=Arthrobacter sp. JCM 19049 TaxID=1460643 RepID=UPI000AD34360|nr:alpha/beta fold hydrolase [Arthrobacter sp. JCM 19049]
MPSITNPADGTEIFFDDDRAAGEAVVYLHGSALSRSIWRGLGYTKTVGAGRRNIRIDLRGHGKSGKPHRTESYTMELITGDVLAVLDSLDIERAHLVGYSFGSRTALSIALQQPERVLSLSMLGGTYAIESGEIDGLFFEATSRSCAPGTSRASSAGRDAWTRRPGWRSWPTTRWPWPPTSRPPKPCSAWNWSSCAPCGCRPCCWPEPATSRALNTTR